jgi:Transcriptional Coactivator p15 (PC4)
MIFSSIRQQIREHVSEIKKIIMAVGIGLIVIGIASFVPLYALWYRPQHPHIQWNLDQQHRWINYGDTIPNMNTLTGIQSKDPIKDGNGWTNRLSPTSVYNPVFIIDYNKCLSRALYTNKRYAGFHTRISLCPYPPYNERIDSEFRTEPVESVTVDIRKFGTNERGDMKTTDRGIALTWDEYITLVKMYKWVEFYYLNKRHFDLVAPPRNESENITTLGSNVELGVDGLYIRPGFIRGPQTTTNRTIGDIW